MVAPLAGAWIEIPFCLSHTIQQEEVAPLAGAWIEIGINWMTSPARPMVAPLAVCRSKYLKLVRFNMEAGVTTFARDMIKTASVKIVLPELC